MSPRRLSRPYLFVFSQTGGGHRAAANAVREAMRLEGLEAEVELVDLFYELTPFPLSQLPRFYRAAVDHASPLWAAAWRATARPAVGPAVLELQWLLAGGRARRALRLRSPGAVVSFHPLANHLFLRARRRLELAVPLVTVVTDLITAHPFWFAPEVDLCLVPTQETARRARDWGISSDRVEVVGLPIDPSVQPVEDPRPFRRRLGLEDRPTALLVGGGEGMGGLGAIARAIAASGLEVQLQVVAGRNRELKERLERDRWPIPMRVYGFVENMPELMAASDVLITKAGPSTVMEGITTGLPIVLSGYIPGQEEGNVRFVVENGAGLLATTPREIVEALREILGGRRTEMRERARRLAHPDAARRIARRLGELAGPA